MWPVRVIGERFGKADVEPTQAASPKVGRLYVRATGLLLHHVADLSVLFRLHLQVEVQRSQPTRTSVPFVAASISRFRICAS